MECDRDGDFRGVITEYGIRKGKDGSKSIGITLRVRFDECWNQETEAWEPWGPFEDAAGGETWMEAEGDSWIVGKEGNVLQKAFEALVSFAGWDGNLLSVSNRTWEPIRCAFSTRANVWNGHATYKVAFINDPNRRPGGVGNVSADEAKLLQDQLGQQFRAIVSNAKRGASKPETAKPSPPPKAEAKAAPKRETVPADNGSKAPDDIPFMWLIAVIASSIGSIFC